MKLISLAVCLGSIIFSYGYFLDSSCTPYKDLITNGTQSAFDMAQAGLDVFNAPSKNPIRSKAQKDLIQYMFGDYPDLKKTVGDQYTAILQYNTNGGKPEATLNNVTNKDTYLSLNSSNLIFFCDYSRFTPNRLCDGSENHDLMCDTLMQIGKLYF